MFNSIGIEDFREKKCWHIVYMKFMDKDRLLVCMQRFQCNLHYL